MSVAILNPWDRLIGPNRFLIEIMRSSPSLARQTWVVFDRATDAIQEYEAVGARVAVLPEIELVHPVPSLSNAFRLVDHHTRGLARLETLLVSVGADVVVSNTESLWLGAAAAKRMALPHVQIFHALSFEARARASRYVRAYLRALTAMSARVVAVSTAVADALVALADCRDPVIVPNPITSGSTSSIPHELAAAREERRGPILLCAGRLCPTKGQDRLLAALAKVREVYPDVLCFFAGRAGSSEGSEDPQAFARTMELAIETAGLREHVRFVGERKDLGAWLGAVDLYVQPSRSESFGRVVAEALLAGTAVACYPRGGIPETAGPGGFFAEDDSSEALAGAILAALGDPVERKVRAARGREHVLSAYDPRRVAGRFEAMLAALRGGTGVR